MIHKLVELEQRKKRKKKTPTNCWTEKYSKDFGHKVPDVVRFYEKVFLSVVESGELCYW